MATLDLQVGASNGDCRTYHDGSAWAIDTSAAAQVAGYNAANNLQNGGGMRFTGVTIPAGATITSAYITFRARNSDSAATANTKIRGEQSNNAATFSTYADYSSRTKTTASVDYNDIEAWTADTEYNSPDISSIIQELVDDYGGLSSANIVLFWGDHDDNSTHSAGVWRRAYACDGGPSYAPKLHIEYGAVTGKTSSDTGSGTDTTVSLETVAAKDSGDSGSGVENTPAPAADLTGSETGSAIEVLINRLLDSLDSGFSAETGGLLKSLLGTELGEGCDKRVARIEKPAKGGDAKLWT